jgi:hypothetical protein
MHSLSVISLWLGATEAQWFRLQLELEAWDWGDPPTLTWLGATEAQWFRLQLELEAWDQGDSPTPTVVGRHWSPVIQTSARIGKPWTREITLLSLWLGASPSDSDFSQNWKAMDQGDYLTLTVVGCHWGPMILTSARIGKPWTREITLLSLWLGATEAQWFWLQPELESHGPGRLPYSHCGWVPLRPSDSDFSQNWKAMDQGDSPILFKCSQGVFMNHK